MPSTRTSRKPENDFSEYVTHAEHCLRLAQLAPNREDRVILREMAAEWLRLYETGR